MKYGPLFGISDIVNTAKELIENIKQFEADGAHGIVLNFADLDREFWTPECFREILSAGRRIEKYTCFYRNDRTQDLTDEDRAKYLMMAAEAGSDIVDIMGDLFDRSEDELTMKPDAIAKQKELAANIKKAGAQVLMSSHVHKPRKTEDALKIFYAHSERGVDISKAVFSCNTEADLEESRRTSEKLCADFPISFVHVCGGEFGRKYQRFETLLNGSLISFVRLKDNDIQPTVKEALAFLRRHTPWACEAGKRECSEFTGRSAVITGAASGMGLLAAKEFAARGASVLLVDINQNAIDEAVRSIRSAGGNAFGIVADVRDYADAEKSAALALNQFNRIDYLLCFAGGYEPRCCKSFVPFYEQPIEVINWGLDVNLKGPVYFARACMPAMIRQNHGVIVCLGSVSGVAGSSDGPMYGTSKSGLFQFVKGLALAGAPHNVRALCVAPGPVLTRPGMATMKTPSGRAAEPIEVVDLIMRMCSERSSFITGTTHFIDGGWLCNFGQ